MEFHVEMMDSKFEFKNDMMKIQHLEMDAAVKDYIAIVIKINLR